MLVIYAMQSQRVAATDRIRLAAIGLGIMGTGDVDTAIRIPGVELVAVADVYEGRLTRAKEAYGKDVFTTRDYREVLVRKDIDAVIIATPDHWHAPIAIAALEAGKDVYCQKPMVQKVEDGLAVVAAEKKSGRILQVGSQCVSSVLWAKLREVIRSGVIGEVHLIEAANNRFSSLGAWQYAIPYDANPQAVDWDSFLGSAPKRPFDPLRIFRWRNYLDYGTGVAGDLFVHQFSGIHFAMDSLGPKRIHAAGDVYFWKDGRDAADIMSGTYEYPKTEKHSAFQLSLRVNFVAAGGEGQVFRFVGTEGAINLSFGSTFSVTKRAEDREPGIMVESFPAEVRRRWIEDYRQKYPGQAVTTANLRGTTESVFRLPRNYSEQMVHHENWIDAIRRRRPVDEDASYGLRAAAPAILSNTSAREGRVVNWDPVAMKLA
jgi:predicted dehydrogenase